MKYSIKGSTFMSDGTKVIDIINGYKLWKLSSYNRKSLITKDDVFDFEVWLNTGEEKDMLFDDLKLIIDTYGGNIGWHECTHDELDSKPCEIVETYRGL